MAAAVLNGLIAKGIVETYIVEVGRLACTEGAGDAVLSPLSEQQQRAFDEIKEDWKVHDVCLLHGVTSSGKTEVYISIIRRICARGRQAIMLIPEISLSFQTLMRFYSHFGDRVSVVNSSLSDAERADQWERARRGEIDVIIGPRSALFTPFANPGVIVIDEDARRPAGPGIRDAFPGVLLEGGTRPDQAVPPQRASHRRSPARGQDSGYAGGTQKRK